MHHAILSQRRADEPLADFYRRVATAMRRRAAEQLRAGRNPEQAAMLAAEYSTRATAVDQAVTR
jgi:hypothetical protein